MYPIYMFKLTPMKPMLLNSSLYFYVAVIRILIKPLPMQ